MTTMEFTTNRGEPDIDGHRYTAIATNQEKGQLADLEVRHRLRARCEGRIRNAKDTGFANLPFKSFSANELWCHVVMMATEIMTWTQMIGFADTKARRWEPKKLRVRLFEIAVKIAKHASGQNVSPKCQNWEPSGRRSALIHQKPRLMKVRG